MICCLFTCGFSEMKIMQNIQKYIDSENPPSIATDKNALSASIPGYN